MVGLLDGLAHLGKLADHLGLEAAGGHGEHVLDHEDLAVGAGACADADGEGRGELLCDVGAQVGGHALEDDGEGAGLLEREGVGDELLGCLGALALTLKPPKALTDCGVRPMWRTTGMPASTMALTWGQTSMPPSSLTAWQRPSFMRRPALLTAVATSCS